MLIGDLQQKLERLARGECLLWQHLAGDYGLLLRALQEAVQAGAPEAGLLSQLEACYQELKSLGAGEAIRRYWAKLNQQEDDIDTERLHRNARALVATALASAYARQSPLAAESVARAEKWAREATELLGGRSGGGCGASLELNLSWTNPPAASELIEQIYAKLRDRGAQVTAARLWSLHWLGVDPSQRRLRVPVACVVGGQGHLGNLHLEWLAGEPAVLVEHPEMALWPIERTLLETLAEAHRGAGGAVVWRFAFRQPEQLGRIPLRGNSAGGAAAVGLRLLAKGYPYDAGCVIVARIEGGNTLAAVGDEAVKLRAAADARLKRAVVAPGTTLDQAAQESLRSCGLEVQRKATLEDACRFASDLPQLLIAYLEGVVEQADAAPPPYLAGRKPSELYVEPDVLVGVRRQKVRRPGAEAARGAAESSGPRYLPDTVLEIGEQYPYGFQVEESEERLSWERARRRLASSDRAAVVLGPPGQGKTQLVRMTARALALEAKAALEEQRESFDRVVLPVVARCQELAGVSSRREFEQRLEQLVADQGPDRQTASYVAGQWKERRCWLFLDGLDEVADPAQLQGLWPVLAGEECRVVLTSRPYAYQGGLPFRQVEYRLAPLTRKQWRELIGRWYGGDSENASQLREQIENSAALDEIAQNPLLVSFVCWVAEPHPVSAEMSRSQLYGQIVPDLLGVDRQGVRDPRRAQKLLPLVREIAWRWFEESQDKRALTHEQLRTWIARSQHRPSPKGLTTQEVANLSPAQQADAIIEELSTEKRFLAAFEHGGRLAYIFPHRSILEFLAAAELVKKLESEDQNRWREFVDRVTWDPGWENVLVFAAGQLGAEANRLVKQLLEGPDDILRRRLALAAVCLAEVPPATRNKALVDAITQQVWEYYSGAEKVVRELDHVWGAWRAAGRLDGAVEGKPLLQKLARDLKGDGEDVERASRALRELGEVAARHSEVIPALLEALKDEDDFVRRSAAAALGRLGEIAAQRADVIPALLGALRDEDPWVRASAAEALGRLGEAATQHPGVIPALLEALKDEDDFLRWSAAAALGRLGEIAAQHPEVIPALLEALRDEHDFVRWNAAEALGRLGDAAAQRPGVIPALLEALRDESVFVRVPAAGALCKLGETAAQCPEVIPALLELLRDEDDFVREWAADALGTLGETAAQRLIPALLEALKNEDHSVRWSAAEALGRLGEAAAQHPEVIPALLEARKDGYYIVRQGAAEALGRLGETAAQRLIPALLEALKDEDYIVRRFAFNALGKLGKTAAQRPEVIPALLEALKDKSDVVRRRAADALRRLGETAAQHPEVIPALLEALNHSWAGPAAARGLGNLGEVAARDPSVLAVISKQPLREPHVFAIVGWDRHGLRVFQDPGGNGLTVRTVEELVRSDA
jgi:HEAT repeat protein